MKITITNPELFVQHKNQIGIMLYSEDKSTQVNFFTGHKHLKLDRKLVEPVSITQIETAIQTNDYLRELAEDHDLVEIQEEYEPDNYMEYYTEFN
jgi:hypothetical protein